MAAMHFHIQAGMLGIPVKVEAAAREERVAVKMVAPQGGPVKQQLVDERDAVVERDQCGRGVEVGGKLTSIPKDKLEALQKKSDKIVHLNQFVPETSVDALYHEASYYLKPEAGAEKAYALLCDALTREGKAGIARATMHQREHLVAIRPTRTGLCLYVLRGRDQGRTRVSPGRFDSVGGGAGAGRSVHHGDERGEVQAGGMEGRAHGGAASVGCRGAGIEPGSRSGGCQGGRGVADGQR